ncbi:hypothetical protein ILYODFUR_011382 [Ilyodon furcidens]|uniref:Uncharacterized protein n=1 Tax=Ilyodon furcidens TaxID=33524 RepID=A0ABV0SMV0_9TELE
MQSRFPSQKLVLVVSCFIWIWVAGAADFVETPRLPSPQTPPPAPPRGAQGIPRPAERHGPSSLSWTIPWASSWWDVPGTPPGGGLYVSNLPQNLLKALPEMGAEYIPGQRLRKTFPADRHYTLGPAKSVLLPPLPAHPTHHQVVINGQLSSSLHPRHSAEVLSSTSCLGCPGAKCTDEQPYAWYAYMVLIMNNQ